MVLLGRGLVLALSFVRRKRPWLRPSSSRTTTAMGGAFFSGGLVLLLAADVEGVGVC
jgi:hypothetical protein